MRRCRPNRRTKPRFVGFVAGWKRGCQRARGCTQDVAARVALYCAYSVPESELSDFLRTPGVPLPDRHPYRHSPFGIELCPLAARRQHIARRAKESARDLALDRSRAVVHKHGSIAPFAMQTSCIDGHGPPRCALGGAWPAGRAVWRVHQYRVPAPAAALNGVAQAGRHHFQPMRLFKKARPRGDGGAQLVLLVCHVVEVRMGRANNARPHRAALDEKRLAARV
eukprot:scaffold76744_cov67-Phaeocystis_antarctica.AAC.6